MKRLLATGIAVIAEFGAQIGFNAVEFAITAAVVATIGFDSPVLVSAIAFVLIYAVSLTTYRVWIYAYDYARIDVYFIEKLKARNGDERTFLDRLPDAIALSAIWPGDAVLATLLLRKGVATYSGLTLKDWVIFASMTMLDAASGTLVAVLGVSSLIGGASPIWGVLSACIILTGLLWRLRTYSSQK